MKPSLYKSLLAPLLAVLIYFPSFRFDYVLDDSAVIKENKLVTEGDIPTLLTTSYRFGYYENDRSLYRPLTPVMFALEWQLAGGAPWLSHVINVLFYALICWFLFFAIQALMPEKAWLALLVPLLFAAHPIHTEVVANIKSRDEIMALFFMLASLWGLWRGLQKKPVLFHSLAMLFFLLALCAKEGAVVLLGIAPLFLYLFSGAQKKLIPISSLLLIPLGIYLLLRYQALGTLASGEEPAFLANHLVGAADGFEFMASAIQLLGLYGLKLLVPYPLLHDYGFNHIPFASFNQPFVWLSAVAWTIVLVWTVRKTLRPSKGVFGWWWIVLGLILPSNLIFIIGTAFGERLLFFPSLGFCLVLGLVLDALLQKWKLQDSFLKTWAFPILILVTYSTISVNRTQDWESNQTLFDKDVQTAPHNARIHYYRGLYSMQNLEEVAPNIRQQQMAAGIESLKTALSIHENYPDALAQLGLALMKSGQAQEGFEKVKRAVDLNPGHFIALNNLGAYYLIIEKNPRLALPYFERSYQANPGYVLALYNLGKAYFQLRDLARARQALRQVLEREADHQGAIQLLQILNGANAPNTPTR